jgi:hypothetical protein
METKVSFILNETCFTVEDTIAFSTRDILLRLFGCSKLVMETNITEFGSCYRTQSIITVICYFEIAGLRC